MTAQTIPALTPAQAARAARARQVLTEDYGDGTYALAVRVGQLEFWVKDLLALVDELDQDGTS